MCFSSVQQHYLRSAPTVMVIALTIMGYGCAAPGGTLTAAPASPSQELGTFASVTPQAAQPLQATELPTHPLAPITLQMLVVHVPRQSDVLAKRLEHLVRSDGVDAGTLQRLERNGIRFGLGQMGTWETITTAIDSIPNHHAYRPDAYRMPPNIPLYLELDETIASRTVFAVGFDGVLNGSNWADSQAVLIVNQQPDLMDSEQVRFSLAPGVRQRRSTVEVGEWPKPVFEEQAFEEATLTLNMAADQYLAIWPSPEAALPQLIGAALFTRTVNPNTADEKDYNTYVFMRFDQQTPGEVGNG